MTISEKPILHGRDHCPGGPDPIPCLMTAGEGFPITVLAIDDLFAYWRLGEPASPWADTSGVGTAANGTIQDSGTALTPDVTGALSAAQDDGAVEFNYSGSGSHGGQYIQAGSVITKDMDLDGDVTFACWAKVKADASTRRGHIFGSNAWSAVGDGYNIGQGFQVSYPSRKLRFGRGQQSDASPELYVETAGGVTADTWYFLAGTYDSTTIRFYVNAELVGTIADPTSATTSVDHVVRFGYTLVNDAVTPASNSIHAWFYGMCDEAAIWTRALTQSEISTLYASGVGAVPRGSQVLISDGLGGYAWGQAETDAIADDAITTLKIDDGTITNDDIDAAADIEPTKLDHPGGTTSFLRADGTWAAPPTGGDPADDTQVWMPLVDSDGFVVLDDTGVIPTLIPLA